RPTALALRRMSKLQQREGERSAFSVPRRSFMPPIRDVGLKRGDRRPPRCYRGAWATYVGAAYGSLTVSPWKCARLLKAPGIDKAGRPIDKTTQPVEPLSRKSASKAWHHTSVTRLRRSAG